MARSLSVLAWLAALLMTPALLAQAVPTQMVYPISAVVDDAGTIFVADRNLPGIWKVASNKPVIHFKAEAAFRTPLNAVRSLALDQKGKLLAGDSATTTVYRFDDDGQPQPAHTGRIGIPTAIAVNAAGDIFVADLEQGRHAIRKIPAGGGEATEFVKVQAPRGMTIDSNGRLYVVQHVGDLLIRIDGQGKIETLVKGQPLTSPSFPAGIVLGKDGTAYMADGYNHAIWKVPPEAPPAILAKGEPLVHPVWVTWHGENLLVVDPRAKTPLIDVTLQGKATPLELKLPVGPPAPATAPKAKQDAKPETRNPKSETNPKPQ